MKVERAEMLHTVDPTDLGRRLRDARVARGWTQTDLAGRDVTVSYVSRIENGTRRPNLKVLTALAERLETPVEQLLQGVTGREYDEIRLGLNYAELALESGEAIDAERQARDHLARAEEASLIELVERGRYLLGRALESLGRLEQAIAAYEELLGTASGLLAIQGGIALCRCHRDAGDHTLAIEAGEQVQAALAEDGLDQTDEAVQLAVTVAAAYNERGDHTQAIRLASRAAQTADRLDSPRARAAAYWNASVFHSTRGNVPEALPLAGRALALLTEGTDARNLARLRIEVGRLHLISDPPDATNAMSYLARALDDLTGSSASTVDLTRCEVQLAQAHLLAGDSSRALELSSEALETAPDRASVLFAEALIVRAQALAASGEDTTAHQACLDAVAALGTIEHDDRTAAQAWFDVAELLAELGDSATAMAALRNAATGTGLQTPRRQRRDSLVSQ